MYRVWHGIRGTKLFRAKDLRLTGSKLLPAYNPKAALMYRSTGLSPDLQAAATAKLSRPALRGIVVIVAMVRAALDERRLPSDEADVIADLCANPGSWVVVSVPRIPYAYLRAPVATEGVQICTVDLRRIRPGSACPACIHPDAWRQLYAAARAYQQRQAEARA